MNLERIGRIALMGWGEGVGMLDKRLYGFKEGGMMLSGLSDNELISKLIIQKMYHFLEIRLRICLEESIRFQVALDRLSKCQKLFTISPLNSRRCKQYKTCKTIKLIGNLKSVKSNL